MKRGMQVVFVLTCLIIMGLAIIVILAGAPRTADLYAATDSYPYPYPSPGGLYLPVIEKMEPQPVLTSGLINGDFEAGAMGWGEYSSNGYRLILLAGDLPLSPHGGSWAAWLGGADDEISAIWQVVPITSDQSRLRYWVWIASDDICGYDVAGVSVDDDIVDAFWLCDETNTGGWALRTVDLGGYAGQAREVMILLGNDVLLSSSLFVDDVAFVSSTSAAGGVEAAAPALAGANPQKSQMLHGAESPVNREVHNYLAEQADQLREYLTAGPSPER